MKKFFFIVLLWFVSQPIFAQIYDNGVRYEFISDDELEVVSYGSSKRHVDLEIPAYFVIDGYRYYVTSIANRAFANCENLESITLPSKVTVIGNDAFSRCTNLYNVVLPSSLVSIGERVFMECTSLTSIKIPKKVETIGFGAFLNCENLSSVFLPSSVEEIGGYAFSNCKSLKTIKLPNYLHVLEYRMFSGCDSLHDVTLPKYVREICYYAFGDCLSLDSISIPKSIREIEYYAFKGCPSLKKVVLEPNIYTVKIGKEAFGECDSLSEFHCLTTKPPVGKDEPFSSYNATLYVPCQSKSEYETNEIWSNFSMIECEDPLSVENITQDDAPESIYDVQGREIPNLQKGLNIVKFKNGNTEILYLNSGLR